MWKSQRQWVFAGLFVITSIYSLISHAQIPSVIIVGAGPAGLVAAQTITDLLPEASILVIKSDQPGQLDLASPVENWPGINRIEGSELQALIQSKTISDNVTIIHDHVEQYSFQDNTHHLMGRLNNYTTDLLIVATGTQAIVPEFMVSKIGQGVHTCVACDGYQYRDQPVIVIGSGSTAVEYALSLADIGADITLAVRGGRLKAEQILQERLIEQKNIKTVFNHNSQWLSYDQSGAINGTAFKHQNTIELIPARGVFSAIGQHPQSTPFLDDLDTDKSGFIVRFNKNGLPWKAENQDSAFITMGAINVCEANLLMASALGIEASLSLAKLFSIRRYIGKKPTIAVLGAGVGGKTAALYGLRNLYDVTLIDPGGKLVINHFWPVVQNEENLQWALDQQLNNLNLNRINESVRSVVQVRDKYLVVTDSSVLEVDGVIANTLEYTPEFLGLHGDVKGLFNKEPSNKELSNKLLPIKEHSNDCEWSGTSVGNILVAGDVAVQPDIPRQAISASYSGYLAGRLAVEKLISKHNTE